MTTKGSLLQKRMPLHIGISDGERGNIWSSAQAGYFLGAILACMLLTLATQYGSGYYNYISIRLLLTSIILSVLLIPALIITQIPSINSKIPGVFSTSALFLFTAVLLILEVVLGLQDNYLHYNQNPFFPDLARILNSIIIFLLAIYFLELFSPPAWLQKLIPLKKYRFRLILLIMIVLKIAAVLSSYHHVNDVDIMVHESIAHLLGGLNPYNTATAGFLGFVYPPLNLLLLLPFYLLFGDIRFGSISWELVGIGLIYQIARTELHPYPKLIELAELAIFIFFLQPRSLFMIEQGCAEPLIVGVLAIFFYAHYLKPTSPISSILLGAALAIKQYLLFMTLPLFILYRFNKKPYLMIGFAFSLFLLPFILWSPFAFYQNTVLHFFQLPIQTNSLGLTAYFSEHGVDVPRWISPIASGLVAGGLGFFLRRLGLLGYLHTLILTFFCLFIFGQQAFANYYYLISFLQMTAIIIFLVHKNHPSSKTGYE